MKKYISLIVFIIIIVLVYTLFINHDSDYKVDYKVDDYEIVEEYYADDDLYSFKVKDKDNIYNFMLDIEYTKDRKIVNKVIKEKVNDYDCLKLKINKNSTDTICYNGKEFVTSNLAKDEEIDDSFLTTVDNISIYNNKLKYYIWNGHGIKDILKGTNYNFLKKEAYDNHLSYVLDKKIIFADYDSTRTFSKFYIFDLVDKSISDFDFEYEIDFDSYFMGDYDGLIYLFDQKNSKQYKININKKKIEISSNNDGGFFYDNEETTRTLKELKYNKYLFNKDKKYNYLLLDNKLYFKLYKSDIKVKVSDLDIDSIIKFKDDEVYYLAKDSLYRFNLKKGQEKLLTNFEWNFTSEGKIFIFN